MTKRLIGLIMLSAMTVGLLSCANENLAHSAQTQESTPQEQEPAEPQEPADSQPPQDEQSPREVEYIRITPQEAEEMMQTEDVIILDVRTQEEFGEGHIPESVLLPSFEVRESVKSVIPDFDQIILVYCRAGSRSETAARELIDLGYTRVYDFGGINSWHGEIVR